MNDELTPDERAAMRSRILGGARDIKPVGAHRGAVIAGAIAAVLVVAIAGGVATTSTLSAPQIANTPSPTATNQPVPIPTPSPTSTPTPTTPGVSLGSAPFDGSCANVIDEQSLASTTGHPMKVAGVTWNDGRATVRGGLTCWWVSTDEYLAASVNVEVFPLGQEPTTSELFADSGCSDGDMVVCTLSDTADGMRIWVRMSGSVEQVTAGSSAILDLVLSRVGSYAPGVAATPTDVWWAPLDCAAVESAVDPSAVGFDSLEVGPPLVTSMPDACGMTFRRADAYWTSFAYVVPGGAVAVPSVAAADASPVEVAGARDAYWASAVDGLDGGGSNVLVVSDGVNLLLVDVSPGNATPEVDLENATIVAERILPLL